MCWHGVLQAPDAQACAGARAGGLAAFGAPAGRAAALPGAVPAQRRPHRCHPQPLQGAFRMLYAPMPLSLGTLDAQLHQNVVGNLCGNRLQRLGGLLQKPSMKVLLDACGMQTS